MTRTISKVTTGAVLFVLATFCFAASSQATWTIQQCKNDSNDDGNPDACIWTTQELKRLELDVL